METDHWYKLLVKIWVQNLDAKIVRSEQLIISGIVEPALPNDLRDSDLEFKKCAESYVHFETATTPALLPCSNHPPAETVTKIIAPVYAIKKRLFNMDWSLLEDNLVQRAHCYYRMTSKSFIGIISRWLRWYSYCDNFSEVEAISRSAEEILHPYPRCRIHEDAIEKRFDAELSKFSSTVDKLGDDIGFNSS
ncbi:unnamed protein product [Linum trigynum]|uniref:Uncharacterized protein n=1 Tax=Linum trigynum TaxID=586398 RepID=A0AAV2DRG9_9ROSI